ncbi:uncharacterized protein LOC129908178, partial [Episyrphus balteatus]|uniref:uncharacterized protein LOC129908178 n=1 Tax=Episyrphus balteatus TaxID=286459 RepID=UPI002485E324
SNISLHANVGQKSDKFNDKIFDKNNKIVSIAICILNQSVLIFSAVIYTSYTLCNSCSGITGIACVASDQYSVCVDGLPTTTISFCPNGTVCTASTPICGPAETSVASCGMCGVCNANGAIACTSYNTFALCYGTTVPDSVNFTCTGTTACVYDDPEICVDPAISGIGGTCPITTPTPTPTTSTNTTTIPSSTINPLIFCSNVTSSGRFEDTTDPTCKQYVLCTLYNSTWIGNIYECPGSTLFNSTSRLCGVEVPLRCASVVP